MSKYIKATTSSIGEFSKIDSTSISLGSIALILDPDTSEMVHQNTIYYANNLNEWEKIQLYARRQGAKIVREKIKLLHDNEKFWCSNCDTPLNGSYNFCPCCGEKVSYRAIE